MKAITDNNNNFASFTQFYHNKGVVRLFVFRYIWGHSYLFLKAHTILGPIYAASLNTFNKCRLTKMT